MAIMNNGRLLRVMNKTELSGNNLETIFLDTIRNGNS
jgi:hypothetical protein